MSARLVLAYYITSKGICCTFLIIVYHTEVMSLVVYVVGLKHFYFAIYILYDALFVTRHCKFLFFFQRNRYRISDILVTRP